VIELLGNDAELLAIADAVAATQARQARPGHAADEADRAEGGAENGAR
jgi:hypothetical protein